MFRVSMFWMAVGAVALLAVLALLNTITPAPRPTDQMFYGAVHPTAADSTWARNHVALTGEPLEQALYDRAVLRETYQKYLDDWSGEPALSEKGRARSQLVWYLVCSAGYAPEEYGLSDQELPECEIKAPWSNPDTYQGRLIFPL